MKKNLLLSLFAIITIFSLVSCGGGGGGGSTSASTTSTAPVTAGVSGTYTASATAGEVLSYTVDTEKLTYSYKILYIFLKKNSKHLNFSRIFHIFLQ
jgi:hypothetical protein